MSSAATSMAHEGQQDYREDVLKYLPLVRSIGLHMCHSLPPSVEFDDINHEGVLGLLDAFTKFDQKKNVSFGVYASYRIRGAILDSLRKSDYLSRSQRKSGKKCDRVFNGLMQELQRSPSPEDLAERMGDEFNQTDSWRTVNGITPKVQFSEKVEVGQESSSSDEFRPDAMVEQRQLSEALSMAVEKLNPRHQKVIQLYYFDGLTMVEIGNQLGVKESRVSQIHKLALAKMRQALQGARMTKL